MHKKIIVLIITAIFISVFAVGCSSSTSQVKNYLGNWQDISDSTRVVKISVDTDNDGYIWEDNEGKYTAKFEKGILKADAKEFGIVSITYDESSKHLKFKLYNKSTKLDEFTSLKRL